MKRGERASNQATAISSCHGRDLKRCFYVSTGSQGQFPITQNVTVVEGTSANMTCRVDFNDNTSLQWSNPAQQTLFFGDKKGKCDFLSLGSGHNDLEPNKILFSHCFISLN